MLWFKTGHSEKVVGIIHIPNSPLYFSLDSSLVFLISDVRNGEVYQKRMWETSNPVVLDIASMNNGDILTTSKDTLSIFNVYT